MTGKSAAEGLRFLGATGLIAERMARHDWAATPVGLPEQWPLSLQTAVRIALRSRFAMWMAWGEALTFFCNDAYLPTLGIKADWALGRSSREVWREIWPEIGPRIDAVINAGVSTWDEGLLLYLERSGVREETYHTFSYSPLCGDAGEIRGMLCVVTEETDRVIGEWRVALLRDLATAFTAVNEESDVLAGLERQLAGARQLLPFSITLLRGPGSTGFMPVASTGIGAEQPETSIGLVAESGLLESVMNDGEPVQIDDLHGLGGKLALSPSGRLPSQALLLPIPGQTKSMGVFIAGLNPDRPFDKAYADFLKLLVGQLSAALAAARLYDLERRRAEELAELDRAKTSFFSNVSHEFRTPLTLLLGPIEEALSGPDAVLAGESLALAHRNALRLLKLTNTLLDFSRIEAGRIESNFEPTDLAAFTAELASLFRSAAERAGLNFAVDCPPLPQAARVDREMWEKIVLNLLSNAYKYTFKGGIRVCLSSAGSDAILVVHDTGAGIPAADLPQIFDRFKRVKGARGRSHEGTGIGLALVQELVKLHGGRVTVSSETEVGTRFTVTIPLEGPADPARNQAAIKAPAHPPVAALPDAVSQRARSYVAEAERWGGAPQSAQASRASTVPGGSAATINNPAARPRILVADDNADMLAYVSRLLADRWDVTAVGDGIAALEAIQRQPPDLVLSDVMMPGLDGFELLKAIRAEPATAAIPFLLLSAQAGEEARVGGLQAGADDYLIKPFSAQELIARVGSAVTLAHARREAMRVEARLKADRDSILESIDEGFVSVDPAWRITYANPAAEKLLGLPKSELVGADLWGLYPALEGTPYGNGLRRAMTERVAARFENYYQPWQRWFDISLYPAPADPGIAIYFRDVTERKETLMALHEADRRKDEFLATLAHELRNPLSPIRNAAEVLALPGVGSREIGLTSSIIRRQVQHMARLLDDLLDISRITRGQMEIQYERTSIGSVVDAALETVQPLLTAHSHALELNVMDGTQTFSGDPVRLAQVLTNLLTNAAKYTPPGGRIRLSADFRSTAGQPGSELLFEVQDSGVGLAAEQLEQVFVMFSQVKAARTVSEGGLGIGLALVKGIVELHGGRVWAQSAGLGQGCSFFVRLPVVAMTSPSLRSPASEPALAATPRKRVLVADDNRDAAESLAMLLELDGHEVGIAHTGYEAIALAHQLNPQIAFLDIGLPDISGYEVARKLRTNPIAGQRIKLVAVTGWGQMEDKQNAADAGFDLHFVKPASPDQLKTLLEGPG